MSVREDVELYTKLSGEDGSQETIATIGAYLRGYRQGKEDAEPHWIPVTEKLPAMGKSVLMCDIDGDIYLGHRTQCGYYYPDFCVDRVKNVTAWCNLPEPYKGVIK